MTIKLKFELSGVSVIKNNNSSCVLRLNINDSRYLLGLKSGNNVNTDVINGTDSFNVQGGSSSVVLSAIEHIDITCSEKSAEQAERLINLRNKLIQNGGSNDINKWVIYLTDVKAGGDEKTLKINNTTIELNNDDFEGGFSAERIEIGAADASSGSTDHWAIQNDFGGFKAVWQKLENDLTRIESYDNLNSNVPQTSVIINEINLLNNYLIKSEQSDFSPEKTIYDFFIEVSNNGGNNQRVNFYKDVIDLAFVRFHQLKIWRELGFDNFKEIRNAIDNGFRIANFIISDGASLDRTIGDGDLIEKNPDGTDNVAGMANIAYIKKRIRNKKYAGVPINVEPSNFKYTLEQLEHFFSNDWFGAKHDNIDYPELVHEGDPRKTRGFKPSDIGEDGKYKTYLGNMSDENKDNFQDGKRCTKIAMDIWNAESLEKAINLAFFGKHYLVNSMSDERYEDGEKSLLYFNEVHEWNEKETLDFYYSVLIKCDTVWGEGNYNNADNKTRIDRIHQIVSEFLDLFLEAKNNINSPDILKTKIKEIKTKYDIPGNHSDGSDEKTKKTLYDHWEKRINQLLGKKAYKTKRQEMLTTWTSEPYKSVLEYDYVENGSDIQILDELEILFNLLKGAYANPPTTKKSQLMAYKSLTDSESDSKKKIQKKLWDIIQSKKVTDSQVYWGDEAISKAKAEGVEDVKTRIKGKMDKVGTDAYDKIVKSNSEIENNPEKLKQIEEIWDAAELAWKETKLNNSLLNKLTNFEKDVNKKEAWQAINAYQKKWEGNKWADSTSGFAEGALNKLKKILNVSKSIDNLYNKADSAEQLATKLQEYVGGEEFKSLDSGQQNRIINIINPRLIAAKGVDTKANKNDDDKKLVILLRLNDLGVQYEESKEGLAKIEKDLDFLKDVKTATSGDKFSARQAMGNEAEKVLKNLIEEMEEKHKQLKKFQSSSNQNPKGSKNPSSFFKSPWFIGLVIAAILIASLIFYLTRNKGNNEEEVQVN